MTAETILLIAYIGLLAVLHVELIRHRKGWFAFLFGIPAIFLWAIAPASAPRVNPGGSIIYFTYHVIPTLGLIAVSAMFWWKIRKKDYPILSAFVVVLAALIFILMLKEIVEWGGRPRLRNQLIGL